MYVVIRYSAKNDVESIMDLVETQEDMISYLAMLLEKDTSLKAVRSMFDESVNRRCVPVATSIDYSYYVQYQKVVKEPSF